MIDLVIPPESHHENTNDGKFLSNVFVSPPLLDQRSISKSSLTASPPRSTTSSDSSLSTTFKLPCKRSHPETPKKSVHFAAAASIYLIEHAMEEWTARERNAVWYSMNELHRLRRSAHQLAETMHFYSDDDLMDRFGVVSVQRQLDRRKEVRNIAECVILLNVDYGLKFWESVPVVIGATECKNEERQKALQLYYLITQLSLKSALRRASQQAKSSL